MNVRGREMQTFGLRDRGERGLGVFMGLRGYETWTCLQIDSFTGFEDLIGDSILVG